MAGLLDRHRIVNDKVDIANMGRNSQCYMISRALSAYGAAVGQDGGNSSRIRNPGKDSECVFCDSQLGQERTLLLQPDAPSQNVILLLHSNNDLDMIFSVNAITNLSDLLSIRSVQLQCNSCICPVKIG